MIKGMGMWALGVLSFLGVMAIFSRLITFPGTATTVDNSVKTGQHLFTGAFYS